MKSRCTRCGSVEVLVHDIKNPRCAAASLPPTVCFACWKASSAPGLRKWYLNVLLELLVLCPLMTFVMWFLYEIWWKYREHWGDDCGFWLWIYLPTMMSVGIVPFVVTQIRLVMRYGPKLELVPRYIRPLVDGIPALLWGLSAFGALIAFTWVWNGRIPAGPK